MSYHSEPITRTLVGDWQLRQVKKLGKKWDGEETEDGKVIVAEEYVKDFVTHWEQISNTNATKEERRQYFRICAPTITLFGLWGIFAFFIVAIAILPRFGIFPGYWIAAILIPTGALVTVGWGLRREHLRSDKYEAYHASFSTFKLAIYALIGTFIGLIHTYFFAGVIFR